MRKNTARHWLHAGLDLLPLILIPVFMIYSHRHTIDSGSIEVPVNRVVDFNQLSKLKNSTVVNNLVIVNYDDYISINGTADTDIYSQVLFGQDVLFETNNKYYISCTGFGNLSFGINGYGVEHTEPYILQVGADWYGALSIKAVNGTEVELDHLTGFVVNLTQMFGSGNEPTAEQFKNWYSNDYYDYTLSHKELLKGYSTQTYDDPDIMSQFTYQMYNAVDKYFNMGNVFGMSNVYDWFNLNIFGGNASISIYIVWNIVLYEFVMDLLFLLYALFMWFIDVTKRLIEKPLDSIK